MGRCAGSNPAEIDEEGYAGSNPAEIDEEGCAGSNPAEMDEEGYAGSNPAEIDKEGYAGSNPAEMDEEKNYEDGGNLEMAGAEDGVEWCGDISHHADRAES